MHRSIRTSSNIFGTCTEIGSQICVNIISSSRSLFPLFLPTRHRAFPMMVHTTTSISPASHHPLGLAQTRKCSARACVLCVAALRLAHATRCIYWRRLRVSIRLCVLCTDMRARVSSEVCSVLTSTRSLWYGFTCTRYFSGDAEDGSGYVYVICSRDSCGRCGWVVGFPVLPPTAAPCPLSSVVMGGPSKATFCWRPTRTHSTAVLCWRCRVVSPLVGRMPHAERSAAL